MGGFFFGDTTIGKKKTQTQQQQSYNQQNTFSQITPQDTADIQAFRGYTPQTDPNIPYRAAAARQRVSESLTNPIGGYYSANTRDAIQRSQNRAIDQDAAQAQRAGQYDVNQMRLGQLGSLASLTAPRIVQSGSSGTGQGTSTTTQSGGLLESILGGAAGVAANYFTGGAAGKNRGSASAPPMMDIFGAHTDVPHGY